MTGFDIDELVFKHEQESRKVGKLMLSSYSQDKGQFFGSNFHSNGINSTYIDSDSYLKGLGHKLDGTFSGKTVPKRDDIPNLMFKSSELLMNTNDTRSRKSVNGIFDVNFNKGYNWSPNIEGTNVQDHIQYSIGSDSRRYRRED
jgi:hypothetical protein